MSENPHYRQEGQALQRTSRGCPGEFEGWLCTRDIGHRSRHWAEIIGGGIGQMWLEPMDDHSDSSREAQN